MSTDTAHREISGASERSGRDAWANQTRAFTTRFARELFRNKTVLFWTLAFPAAFYLLTVSLFIDHGSLPAGVMPYVKAGTAVTYGTFGAIIASLNAFGQQLAMDFEDERYRLYRSMPIAPSADLAGRMVAGVALSVVAFGVVLLVAVANGASFDPVSPLSVGIVLVSLVSFAVFWMVVAVLVTVAVRDARYASLVTVSLAMALYFLTGFNGGNPSFFTGPEVVLNWLPNTLPTRLISGEIARVPASFEFDTGLASPDPLVGTATVLGYAIVAAIVGLVVTRRVIYGRRVFP